MNNGRIYFELTTYKVFEDYSLSRCRKCCAYGHTIKNCLNKFKCTYCAKEHNSESCGKKDNIKCINCSLTNNNHNLRLNTNHYAHDISHCKTYSKLKDIKIKSTNYSVQ